MKLTPKQVEMLDYLSADVEDDGRRVYGQGEHRTCYALEDRQLITFKREVWGTVAWITDRGRAALEEAQR